VNTGFRTVLKDRSRLPGTETSAVGLSFRVRDRVKKKLGSVTLDIGPIVDVKFEGELPPICSAPWPEQAFDVVGGVEDVVAKAQRMKGGAP